MLAGKLSTLLPLSFKCCNDDNEPMLSGSVLKLQEFSNSSNVKDRKPSIIKCRFDALSCLHPESIRLFKDAILESWDNLSPKLSRLLQPRTLIRPSFAQFQIDEGNSWICVPSNHNLSSSTEDTEKSLRDEQLLRRRFWRDFKWTSVWRLSISVQPSKSRTWSSGRDNMDGWTWRSFYTEEELTLWDLTP